VKGRACRWKSFSHAPHEMSAKKRSQQTKPTPSNPAPTAPAAAASATSGATAATAEENVPWIESADPRRRMIGKIALVVLWIYVAALCLLAVDQWFNLGIFGPKIPPLP
jgi:hypothetical protein